MIKRLSHACIVVSDMDKALAFYRDTLGLKVRMDFDVSGEETGFDRIFQNPGIRFRIVYFEEGVELAYFYSPSDGKPLLNENVRFWDHGNTLLIFEVSDLDKIYSDLVAKGVKFFAPPQSPEPKVPTIGRTKVTHLQDPDGVRISLLESFEAK